MNVRYLGAFALSAALSVCAMGPALAALSNPVAAVHQFVDAFNKGDLKTGLAACADQTAIIDEFPPHSWSSCAAWATAFDANSKQNGITDAVVTLAKPAHVDVTGSVAYTVFPATYAWKQKGKPMSENSLFTAVLKRSDSGWHITSWCWANK